MLSGIADLDGQGVAVERGYIAGEWLSETSRGPPDRGQGYPYRPRGGGDRHADAYFGNLRRQLLDRQGRAGRSQGGSFNSRGPGRYGMGVRKDWPELAVMLDKVSPHQRRGTPGDPPEVAGGALRTRHPTPGRGQWVAVVVAVALVWIIQLRLTVRRKTRKLKAEIARREAQEQELARSLGEVEAAHRKLQLFIEGTPWLCRMESGPAHRGLEPAAEKLLGWTAAEVLDVRRASSSDSRRRGCPHLGGRREDFQRLGAAATGCCRRPAQER